MVDEENAPLNCREIAMVIKDRIETQARHILSCVTKLPELPGCIDQAAAERLAALWRMDEQGARIALVWVKNTSTSMAVSIRVRRASGELEVMGQSYNGRMPIDPRVVGEHEAPAHWTQAPRVLPALGRRPDPKIATDSVEFRPLLPGKKELEQLTGRKVMPLLGLGEVIWSLMPGSTHGVPSYFAVLYAPGCVPVPFELMHSRVLEEDLPLMDQGLPPVSRLAQAIRSHIIRRVRAWS